MQTDMTVGKPMKMLLNFTIPVFLGNVFSTAVQYGRCSYCWKVCWNQGAGSGRRYWNHYVPYYWISDGGYTGVTVLTSQKFGAGRMG